MFQEFPKALYRGGAWDGVSEPDCVTVQSVGEQEAQAANGYWPLGEAPAAPPDTSVATSVFLAPQEGPVKVDVVLAWRDGQAAVPEIKRKPGRPRKDA